MKVLLLMLLVHFASPVEASDVSELIEQLPGIRLKALTETADLRAGSTTEMADAATVIRKRLLPSIVVLESKLEGKSEKEVQTQIERDLEAISRDVYIKGHSGGWGGTAVSVDAAWAVVEHLQARASWCVWRLTKDSKTFEIEKWRARWNSEDEGGTGQPATRPESKSEGGDKPQPEAERRFPVVSAGPHHWSKIVIRFLS